jgi:hypothetical protein
VSTVWGALRLKARVSRRRGEQKLTNCPSRGLRLDLRKDELEAFLSLSLWSPTQFFPRSVPHRRLSLALSRCTPPFPCPLQSPSPGHGVRFSPLAALGHHWLGRRSKVAPLPEWLHWNAHQVLRSCHASHQLRKTCVSPFLCICLSMAEAIPLKLFSYIFIRR